MPNHRSRISFLAWNGEYWENLQLSARETANPWVHVTNLHRPICIQPPWDQEVENDDTVHVPESGRGERHPLCHPTDGRSQAPGGGWWLFPPDPTRDLACDPTREHT